MEGYNYKTRQQNNILICCLVVLVLATVYSFYHGVIGCAKVIEEFGDESFYEQIANAYRFNLIRNLIFLLIKIAGVVFTVKLIKDERDNEPIRIAIYVLSALELLSIIFDCLEYLILL